MHQIIESDEIIVFVCKKQQNQSYEDTPKSTEKLNTLSTI
jgi:hypothetical protein